MTGRYGNLDNKKDIEYLLETGCSYLKSVVKDYDNEDKEKVFGDLNNLKNVLYREGQILSMTNKVKFEKRINALEKNLVKLYQGKEE